MKWTWIGAVALLGLIGCGGRVQHIWDSPGQLSVPKGPSCVSGPFVNPSGGAMFYDITDTYGDDMDVAILAVGDGCDASSPYGWAMTSSTNWSGSVSTPAVSAPAGPYNLAVTCFNNDYCTPFVGSFGYEN